MPHINLTIIKNILITGLNKNMNNYENTIKDIENTWGIVPDFMKVLSRQSLVNDWPSWKKEKLSEIDMERASFLLNMDGITVDILEGPQKVPDKARLELKASYREEFTDSTGVMEEMTGEVRGIEKNFSLRRPELIRDIASIDRHPLSPRFKNRDGSLLEN